MSDAEAPSGTADMAVAEGTTAPLAEEAPVEPSATEEAKEATPMATDAPAAAPTPVAAAESSAASPAGEAPVTEEPKETVPMVTDAPAAAPTPVVAAESSAASPAGEAPVVEEAKEAAPMATDAPAAVPTPVAAAESSAASPVREAAEEVKESAPMATDAQIAVPAPAEEAKESTPAATETQPLSEKTPKKAAAAAKAAAEEVPPADKPAAIRKQVEYYFSRGNMRRDRFLQGEIRKHPEGYVQMSVLGTFPKLKKLSEDLKEIADALRLSPDLIVSEDGTLVKSTVDHLKGLTDPVVLADRKFGNAEECRRFFRELVHRYKDGDVVAQKDFEFLRDLLQLHHPTAKEKMGSGIKEFKVGHNPKFPDNKTLCYILVRTDGSEEDFSYLKCVNAAFAHFPKERAPQKPEKPKPEPKPAAPRTFVPDVVVKCAGLPGKEGPENFKKVKEYFTKFGAVAFVDDEAASEGVTYIRFKEAGAAKAAVAEAAHSYTEDVKLTVTAVTGDEEKEYYERLWAKVDSNPKKRTHDGGKGGKGKGKGKGGKGGKGKGGRGGEPDSKRQKTDNAE